MISMIVSIDYLGSYVRKDVLFMTQKTLSILIDEELFNQLEIFCKEIGLNISTLFTLFSEKVVKEQRIPFDIELNSFYSKENMAHLNQAIRNLNDGKGVEHALVDVEV